MRTYLHPAFKSQPLGQRIANRLIPHDSIAPKRAKDAESWHRGSVSARLQRLPWWRQVAIALLLGVHPWRGS